MVTIYKTNINHYGNPQCGYFTIMHHGLDYYALGFGLLCIMELFYKYMYWSVLHNRIRCSIRYNINKFLNGTFFGVF